jgi:site-specific DNA-adenine methylase
MNFTNQQQDAYILQFKKNPESKVYNILIDTGMQKQVVDKLLDYLAVNEIFSIDEIFITHPHKDHYDGMWELIKFGIPIGGYKQSGKWKIDARFNKKELIKRIRAIAKYKNKIEIYNLDAIELINKIQGELSEETLIYFDPPYYVKGKALYENHYTHKDHVLVAKTIRQISEPRWIVSYDNVKEITELYKKFRKRVYNLNYSLINGTIGKEVMFFSKNLVYKK